MSSETLVLFSRRNAYYFENISNRHIVIDRVLKSMNGFERFIFKVMRKLSLPFTNLFYDSWYNDLAKYSKIVVFDVCFQEDPGLLYNISRKAPGAEKYFYSWNIVKNEERYKKMRQAADSAGFKYFCYDHGNCEKYGMNFNTIMYDKNTSLPVNKPEYDTFFLGYLKDRKDKLLSLYNAMDKAGIKARFLITAMNGEIWDNTLPFEYSEKYIGYYDYLDMLSRSRAILDISQEGQDGYSMRVMEAIFFNKKLLTTNTAVKNADFYDENKILIIELGKTTSEEIKKFFEKEYEPYSDETRKYYSFEAWIERFC